MAWMKIYCMCFSRWAIRSNLKLLLGILACLWFASVSHAELIDRIVAVVEKHVITLSDIREEREIRTSLGEATPEDNVLAKDLVDNFIIERQIADYPNVDVTDVEVQDTVRSLSATTRISDALRNAIRRRIRMQKFFAMKFGESIQPNDAQIQKYYAEDFVPAARARGLNPIPPLTDPEMMKAVRDNLIQESLHHEVSVWLEAIRRRSNIEVFE
jgi:hypothetical protein